jgi:hypothetical protein
MEPATLMAIAGGAKALGGLAQTIFSGERRAQKKLESEIEGIKFPSILEYYEQAKQRHGVSPTQTALYKRQMQNIQRAGATSLAGAGGARGRMAATPAIARSLSDATLAAEVAAEGQQERRFGALGSAAQMKTQAELAKQNQRISAAAAKAAGAAAIKRAGLTNIFGGLTDIASAFGEEEENTGVRNRNLYKNSPRLAGREAVGTLPRTRAGLGG